MIQTKLFRQMKFCSCFWVSMVLSSKYRQIQAYHKQTMLGGLWCSASLSLCAARFGTPTEWSGKPACRIPVKKNTTKMPLPNVFVNFFYKMVAKRYGFWARSEVRGNSKGDNRTLIDKVNPSSSKLIKVQNRKIIKRYWWILWVTSKLESKKVERMWEET